MPKSRHKALIDSLKARFPHLASEIQASARAIYDAHQAVYHYQQGTIKKANAKATITALGKMGAMPHEVAKYFLEEVITGDPPVIVEAYLNGVRQDHAEVSIDGGTTWPYRAFQQFDVSSPPAPGPIRFMAKVQITGGTLTGVTAYGEKRARVTGPGVTIVRIDLKEPKGGGGRFSASLEFVPDEITEGGHADLVWSSPAADSAEISDPMNPAATLPDHRPSSGIRFTPPITGAVRAYTVTGRFLVGGTIRATKNATLTVRPPAPPPGRCNITVAVREPVYPNKDFEVTVTASGGPFADIVLYIDGSAVHNFGGQGATATLRYTHRGGLPEGNHAIRAEGILAGETEPSCFSSTVRFRAGPPRPVAAAPPARPRLLAPQTWMRVPAAVTRDKVTRALHDGRHELDRFAREYYEDARERYIRELRIARVEARNLRNRLRAAGQHPEVQQNLDRTMASLAVTAAAPEAAVLETILPQALGHMEAGRRAEGAPEDTALQRDLRTITNRIDEIQRYSETRFESDLRDYLGTRTTPGIIARIVEQVGQSYAITDEGERSRLREGLYGEAAWLAGYYARALRHREAPLFRALHVMLPKMQVGTAKSTTVFAEFIKGWWGVWLLPLIYFLVSPTLGWFIFVIWGLFKLPPVTGALVWWLQFTFLTGGAAFLGGAILGFLELPGYTAIDRTLLVILALIGGLLNWAFHMSARGSHVEGIFEGTMFGALTATLSHILGGAIIFTGVGMFVAALGFPVGWGAFAGIAVGAGIIFFAVLAGVNPELLPMFILIGGFIVPILIPSTAGVLVPVLLFMLFATMGITYFYTQGGLPAVNVIALVVMVFSYMMLGPYSGYVVQVKDQIGAPIKAVSSYAQIAFTDIWLLLTNPTEYYAQQQLRQIRPERPLSFPKGVELISLDAIPPVVPANEQFSLFAAFENQGDLPAREVTATARCVASAPRDADTCSRISGAETYGPVNLNPGQADRTEWRFTAGGRRDPRNKEKFLADTVFNNVNLTLSYALDTSSSLQVEVATSQEIQRRQTQPGARFYYPQVATAKVGPAQLSISVGPQPLVARPGQTATAIIAVTNSRPDGQVIFRSVNSRSFASPSGQGASKVEISLSPVVGKDLQCSSGAVTCRSGLIPPGLDAPQTAVCDSTENSYILERYEARSVIPIFCNFTVAEVNPQLGSITGLITASMTNYQFNLLQSKAVQVTAPLGTLPVAVQAPPTTTP